PDTAKEPPTDCRASSRPYQHGFSLCGKALFYPDRINAPYRVFDTPKTQAGLRRVPLSAAAVQVIGIWHRRVDAVDPDALVFRTWSGKPISPNNVLKPIVAAAKALGLPKPSWLTFRRTYSSWAHEKGVPGKVVATLMGHAKVDTTLNVYTQVLDDSLRGAAEKVGSELITIDHKSRGANELTPQEP